MNSRCVLLVLVMLASVGCKEKEATTDKEQSEKPAAEPPKEEAPAKKTEPEAATPPVDAATPAGPLASLKGGMSAAEVEAILGKPAENTSGGECTGNSYRWDIEGKSHELRFDTCVGGSMPWAKLLADKEQNGSNALIEIDGRALDCGRIELSITGKDNKSAGSIYECKGGKMSYINTPNPPPPAQVNVNLQAKLWKALDAAKWDSLTDDCPEKPGESTYQLAITRGAKQVSLQCKAEVLKPEWAAVVRALRDHQPNRR